MNFKVLVVLIALIGLVLFSGCLVPPQQYDPQECYAMDDQQAKNSCFSAAVSQGHDPKYCEEISSKYVKNNCYSGAALASSDIKYCNMIDKTDQTDNTFSSCIVSLAIKKNDASICNALGTGENCKIYVWKRTGRMDLCEQIENIDWRNTCFMEIADYRFVVLKNFDVSDCDRISDVDRRNFCIGRFTGDYKACLKIPEDEDCPNCMKYSCLHEAFYYPNGASPEFAAFDKCTKRAERLPDKFFEDCSEYCQIEGIDCKNTLLSALETKLCLEKGVDRDVCFYEFYTGEKYYAVQYGGCAPSFGISPVFDVNGSFRFVCSLSACDYNCADCSMDYCIKTYGKQACDNCNPPECETMFHIRYSPEKGEGKVKGICPPD